ncbi:unnamed protein product [Boreogadus saida]
MRRKNTTQRGAVEEEEHHPEEDKGQTEKKILEALFRLWCRSLRATQRSHREQLGGREGTLRISIWGLDSASENGPIPLFQPSAFKNPPSIHQRICATFDSANSKDKDWQLLAQNTCIASYVVSGSTLEKEKNVYAID